jgi:ParB-like nuclease domain
MQRQQGESAMSTTATEAAVPAADPFAEFDEDAKPEAAAAAPAKRRTANFDENQIVHLRYDQLVMSKQDPLKRTYSKEFSEKLAKSIDNEGLLNPPYAVKLPPDADGIERYNVKVGRHRVIACFKHLKWETMPFRVIEDGPDDLAEAIDIASNLFVNPLNEPQTRVALERWYQIYTANHPKSKTLKGKDRTYDGFAAEVKSILPNVSKRQSHRLATTAANISPDARVTLEKAGVPQSKIDEIAAIKEPEAIDAAVKLTASGMNPDEAIRQGKKAKSEKVKKEAKAAGKTVEPEPKKKADEMTDEEWLTTHCKKLLDALAHKVAFKRDAILYRRTIEHIAKFRTSTKKALAEAKKPGENGLFFSSFVKMVRAAHPMQWFICDKCNGKAFVPVAAEGGEIKNCGKCLGGGYIVKFEET